MRLTDKNELFGKDSYIQDNKSIKRKWQLQNISSLHKVENKFRKLNMMYTHVTKSDLELKQSQVYLERLIVNKQPGQITIDPNSSRPNATLNRQGTMLTRQLTIDVKQTGQLEDRQKLSMISERSGSTTRNIESQVKFQKNLLNEKRKRKRIHIPGQNPQFQI